MRCSSAPSTASSRPPTRRGCWRPISSRIRPIGRRSTTSSSRARRSATAASSRSSSSPPQALSAMLLQEAARRAPVVRGTRSRAESWFARFVRSFVSHPAMAAAAMLVVVVGVAGTMYMKNGTDQVAQPTADRVRSRARKHPPPPRPLRRARAARPRTASRSRWQTRTPSRTIATATTRIGTIRRRTASARLRRTLPAGSAVQTTRSRRARPKMPRGRSAGSPSIKTPSQPRSTSRPSRSASPR